MIDLVKTHLTHPWGPPWTLETLGGPWRPLATCLKMTNFPQIGSSVFGSYVFGSIVFRSNIFQYVVFVSIVVGS